jgi:signal transduction histidine kinase
MMMMMNIRYSLELIQQTFFVVVAVVVVAVVVVISLQGNEHWQQ